MARVDRTKHDIDVLERVIGRVRDSAPHAVTGDSQFVVDVHVAPDEPPRRRRDDQADDRYKSDRRGEHRYPVHDEDGEARPSQRERDELKERLERRR